MPTSGDPTERPQDPEKCISVAYLRLLGASMADSAKSVGVHKDTIWRWEQCSWWKDMLAEASRRWLSGLEGKARATLFDNLDGPLSLKVLERRLPELAPPNPQPQDLTGTITLRVVWDTPDADE
jgi:hypothetical protein